MSLSGNRRRGRAGLCGGARLLRGTSSNFEGIAVAPEAECVGGQTSFFWSDDSQLDMHAVRRGSIACGAFFQKLSPAGRALSCLPPAPRPSKPM